ncbi:16S rRNA (cytosine(1402)-N(4))-methyltransferase RsmH [Leuconostoc falkenbergense]|jgi:16S rRNA (cytosine1402-N4)-methyltransferase|uniref:Ribosomal RNA small subunit methyltransferase H n=2 Tax=Leuconostoc TaxID=1243 RepID=A0A9X3EIN0_9LACO|nr:MULTISPECIES: 16S rRNA (cytosine(1402)-N(4))-methyltransferase RsmH [Leuconostoc]KDA48927.1 rRNA small subunit methyltransferase H [Leuconostoc pseudomesenteroides 1159]KDA49947.1 rRNA small subunit methyltransferase H [Leuconostoc pseudomesenteroides PS12]CCJ67086.1 rRNA small subunit methyltransferase H [Leuconostoc pseudomesenteroides 4882]MCT4377895.1 16S rRNA (cytosine(1402)-N(4))-methyltransferase RsmH [Leuconostoc falkenbergense]MCT4390327.1 16S rRNA (cytosine(1402)-N(4))-methyltrans
MTFEHVTVLLHEAIELLDIKPDGIYVDATLGGGGHTGEILKQLTTGKLYSFDQDDTAIQYNMTRYADDIAQGKLVLIHQNFRTLTSALATRNIQNVDGIVYDLGVSSVQFDDGQRGFSYNYDAELDMRMDQRQTLTAKTIVNEWSFNELLRVLSRYGEDRFPKQIARKIEQHRENGPINTTFELVDIIKEAIPAPARRKGGHPAKRTFQALRIAVNDELGALEDSLTQALDLIDHNGRISVITFQSLEDRLVKQMFREKTSAPELPAGLPVLPGQFEAEYDALTRKPILPSAAEMSTNHRSESAKLRGIRRK